ncbi:hypothetical protein HDU84_000285, partial [Entophlyctis sp. JEL0112]
VVAAAEESVPAVAVVEVAEVSTPEVVAVPGPISEVGDVSEPLVSSLVKPASKTVVSKITVLSHRSVSSSGIGDGAVVSLVEGSGSKLGFGNFEDEVEGISLNNGGVGQRFEDDVVRVSELPESGSRGRKPFFTAVKRTSEFGKGDAGDDGRSIGNLDVRGDRPVQVIEETALHADDYILSVPQELVLDDSKSDVTKDAIVIGLSTTVAGQSTKALAEHDVFPQRIVELVVDEPGKKVVSGKEREAILDQDESTGGNEQPADVAKETEERFADSILATSAPGKKRGLFSAIFRTAASSPNPNRMEETSLVVNSLDALENGGRSFEEGREISTTTSAPLVDSVENASVDDSAPAVPGKTLSLFGKIVGTIEGAAISVEQKFSDILRLEAVRTEAASAEVENVGDEVSEPNLKAIEISVDPTESKSLIGDEVDATNVEAVTHSTVQETVKITDIRTVAPTVSPLDVTTTVASDKKENAIPLTRNALTLDERTPEASVLINTETASNTDMKEDDSTRERQFQAVQALKETPGIPTESITPVPAILVPNTSTNTKAEATKKKGFTVVRR